MILCSQNAKDNDLDVSESDRKAYTSMWEEETDDEGERKREREADGMTWSQDPGPQALKCGSAHDWNLLCFSSLGDLCVSLFVYCARAQVLFSGTDHVQWGMVRLLAYALYLH